MITLMLYETWLAMDGEVIEFPEYNHFLTHIQLRSVFGHGELRNEYPLEYNVCVNPYSAIKVDLYADEVDIAPGTLYLFFRDNTEQNWLWELLPDMLVTVQTVYDKETRNLNIRLTSPEAFPITVVVREAVIPTSNVTGEMYEPKWSNPLTGFGRSSHRWPTF